MKKDKLAAIRHTFAHLLAWAVQERDPDVQLAIGPVIEDGFYYDMLLSKPLSESDLRAIEDRMRELATLGYEMVGRDITYDEAKTMFGKSPFKLELIEELRANGEKLTSYTLGSFVDLCRGGHVGNTSELPLDAFKLDKLAGAYWRGNELNQMLTRVYGLAFHTKKDLDGFVTMREEAKKRDHRKIGKELDLFVLSPLVGAGLPLFTPKGTVIRDVLDSFVWELRKDRGYERVDIPHITKPELFHKSGHWDKFADELFHVSTREGHEYALKPMNCPHHTQIFDRKPISYREMPVRYANTTKVYRDEQSGELGGLSRVLSITQDDAHVFCRFSQMKDEFFSIWDIIETFYDRFGFDLRVRLSFHDPAKMENYLGTPLIWARAEDALRAIARERGVSAEEAPGDAAMYGPKVDFVAKDSIGRDHQVATIQLDMNMPERFDLACTNEKGERERVVMLHAAIMGSVERFMAVMIEHFAGAFPTWLAPVQAAVLPIGEKHRAYARDVYDKLRAHDVRVELWNSDETLGKKIREGKRQKIPFILIVGDQEVANSTITVESRDDGKLGERTVEELYPLFL